MGEKKLDYSLNRGTDGVTLTSDLIEGAEADNPSDYKIVESSRIKDSWEGVIQFETDINRPLSEVNHILRENDHEMEAHITGEDYLEVSNGEKTKPETMHLRISQTPDQLQSIDNYFFQNIDDTGTLYRIGGTSIGFELGPLYDETVDIKTGFNYLDVKAPTHQSFFRLRYSQALEELSDEYGTADIDDVFSEYF